MAEGPAGHFQMDDDAVESLLRTLEEMTDSAINKGSPLSDEGEGSEMSKWLEAPLGHFFDACASIPQLTSSSHLQDNAARSRQPGNPSFASRFSEIRVQSEPGTSAIPAPLSVASVNLGFQSVRSPSVDGVSQRVIGSVTNSNRSQGDTESSILCCDTNSFVPACDKQDITLFRDIHDFAPFRDHRNTMATSDHPGTVHSRDHRNTMATSDHPDTVHSRDHRSTMTLADRDLEPRWASPTSHLTTFLKNDVTANEESDENVDDVDDNSRAAVGNSCLADSFFATKTLTATIPDVHLDGETLDNTDNSRESTNSTMSSWDDLLNSIDQEEKCSSCTDSNRFGGMTVLQVLAQSRPPEVVLEDSPSRQSPSLSPVQNTRSAKSTEWTAVFEKYVPKEKKTTAPAGHAQKLLPPCRICSQPGTGLHYGVNTCEACKGFFRRSLVRKRPYVCKGRGACDLNGNQKRICAACRYKRCLSVGMSQEAIKQGRYTYQKRTQDYYELQRLEAASGLDGPHLTDVDVDAIVEGLLDASKHVLTNADVPADVMEWKSRQASESCELRKRTFGLHALSPEEHEEIYRTTGIDIDGRKSLIEFVATCLERYIKGYVRFARGIPHFKHLPLNDQANLLKAGRKEFWYMGAYKGYSKKYQTFYAPNGVVYTKTEQALLLGNEYCDYEFKIADQFQRWDVTRDELVVLKAICLAFTDRCDLEEPKKVEEIQTLLLKCFYMLLSRRHDNPNMAFAQALDKLVALRDLTEFDIKNRSRTLVRSAYMEHPVLREVALF